jgi:uroporphyrinogen-III decarboxylase
MDKIMAHSSDFQHFQEGAKRLEIAMGGIPDRVPVYAQIHEFAMKEMGISARDFYTTPELLVPACLEITEKMGIDVAAVDYDVYNIEAEALGQKVIYFDDHMPDVDRATPLIRGPDDLYKIRTPDFDQDARFPMVLEVQSLWEKLTGVSPTLQFTAPFSLAANIRGIEPLIMDILTNPGFARGIFDAIVEEILTPWILFQKKCFPRAKAVGGADATASIPVLNLKLVEEWVVPYILKLRTICGPEVYVPNWIGERYLKDPVAMLDLKRQVSPDFVEGQDPDVAALRPEFYKTYAEEHDLPLVLGVGAGFLAQASPREVTARVKDYIQVGGANGCFALYLCNLGANTPAENIRAAIRTVHDFGKYNS